MIHPHRLRASALFESAGDEALNTLASSCERRSLRAAEVLVASGTPAEHFFLVERGILQGNRDIATGAVETIALFGPRDLVALAAALSVPRYPVSVVATMAVEAIRISVTALRQAMADDAAIHGALPTVLLEHVERLRAKAFIVSAGSTAARLASLLLHVSERFAEGASKRRPVTIPFALPRATMAGMVSARPETVSRTLARFRRAGIVTGGDSSLVIDPEPLRRLATAG